MSSDTFNKRRISQNLKSGAM